MIVCRDLIKIYIDNDRKIKIPALRGTDLNITEGEIISIVGPSGSGKTTLINILSGLETITSGFVEVAGYNLEKMSLEEKNAYRLNMISNVDQFPERNLFLNISVIDNVQFYQMLRFGFVSSLISRINQILEKLGIEHLKNRIVKTLSGGEMTRVAIACALAKKTPVILCDEPTGQLDSDNTEKVKKLLLEVSKEFKTTILVVTHDLRFLDEFSKTCEIRNGRISVILNEEERKAQSTFPLHLKSHIDSTRSARIPDLIYDALKLETDVEYEVSENSEITIKNPKSISPEKIIPPKPITVPKKLDLKKIPSKYKKGKELVIHLKNVNKSYEISDGKIKVLNSISLKVFEGELLFILGPSGSGKTTLLKVMTGLEPSSSGSIEILGTDFSVLSDAQKADFRLRNFGLIAQQGNLHPHLTVKENFYIKDIFLKDKNNDNNTKQKIDELLSRYKIAHRQESFPLEVSGGELQRASLAIAAYRNPKILFLDEPTANLDYDLAKETINKLVEFHKAIEITLIIATHDLSLLQENHRAIEINDGKIINDGLVSMKKSKISIRDSP